VKAKEIETIARKSMGVTYGVWTAKGGVLCCDGVPMFTAAPGATEWQAEANAGTLASLMNARVEIIYSLENLPLLHEALKQADLTNCRLRSELDAMQPTALAAAA